jgi:hypothetical protein
MDEGYDLGDFEAVVAHAMQQGYIVDYEPAESGTAVRLITRPKYIRQEVTRFCEVLTKATLAHVEQAVAAIDAIRDDSLRRVSSSPSPSGSGPTWLPWARACRARPRAPGRR